MEELDPSVAMQNEADVQDKALIFVAPMGLGADHVAPFQVRYWEVSTATQNVADGHESAVTDPVLSMVAKGDHVVPFHWLAWLPCAVGSVPVATQNVADAQEMATIFVWRLALGREVGLVQDVPSQVLTEPPQSPAAQNVADAQEMVVSEKFASMVLGGDHAVPSQVTTAPASSTASQNTVEGQETDVGDEKELVRSMRKESVHEVPSQTYAPVYPSTTHRAWVAHDTPGPMRPKPTNCGGCQEVPSQVVSMLSSLEATQNVGPAQETDVQA